jgi:hypothetical protein
LLVAILTFSALLCLFFATKELQVQAVDKLFISFPVGARQRLIYKRWRDCRPGPFEYNEGPTSSCQTFCWKARHFIGRAFFLASTWPPEAASSGVYPAL